MFTAAEVEANSNVISDRKLRGAIPDTGESCQLLWAKFEPGGTYGHHSHPHEQIVNVLEGTFELVMEGASHILGPGDVLVIRGDVPHSGRAHTGCKIIDVFSPVREDYR